MQMILRHDIQPEFVFLRGIDKKSLAYSSKHNFGFFYSLGDRGREKRTPLRGTYTGGLTVFNEI